MILWGSYCVLRFIDALLALLSSTSIAGAMCIESFWDFLSFTNCKLLFLSHVRTHSQHRLKDRSSTKCMLRLFPWYITLSHANSEGPSPRATHIHNSLDFCFLQALRILHSVVRYATLICGILPFFMLIPRDLVHDQTIFSLPWSSPPS